MRSKVSALLAEPLDPTLLGGTVPTDRDRLGARRTAVATAMAALGVALRGLAA